MAVVLLDESAAPSAVATATTINIKESRIFVLRYFLPPWTWRHEGDNEDFTGFILVNQESFRYDSNWTIFLYGRGFCAYICWAGSIFIIKLLVHNVIIKAKRLSIGCKSWCLVFISTCCLGVAGTGTPMFNCIFNLFSYWDIMESYLMGSRFLRLLLLLPQSKWAEHNGPGGLSLFMAGAILLDRPGSSNYFASAPTGERVDQTYHRFALLCTI